MQNGRLNPNLQLKTPSESLDCAAMERPKSNPIVMGILNRTPDSFSDGGLYMEVDSALRHAKELAEAGADLIDIGGCSTRPGAAAVSEQEELDRVIPVIEQVTRLGLKVSVDTFRPLVARHAVSAGAEVINDVHGGRDIEMARVCLDFPQVSYLMMHMQGTPETMQVAPTYPRGVVQELREYFSSRLAQFEEIGVARNRIWIDPGIGFGKTLQHNLELMKNLGSFVDLAGRLAVGTSRKSFLSRVLGTEATMAEREPGTLATNLWARTCGASVFRVHDVAAFRRALSTWEAIRDAR